MFSFGVAVLGLLVLAELAVFVLVNQVFFLESRDFGHIQHKIDVYPGGSDLNPAVLVDCKVAQRVGEGGRR